MMLLLYIYIVYYWMCYQFKDYFLQINDSDLFTWISLAALSRTYFIY